MFSTVNRLVIIVQSLKVQFTPNWKHYNLLLSHTHIVLNLYDTKYVLLLFMLIFFPYRMKVITVQWDSSKNYKNAILLHINDLNFSLYITQSCLSLLLWYFVCLLLLFKQCNITVKKIIKVLEQHQRDHFHFNRPSCMQSTLGCLASWCVCVTECPSVSMMWVVCI